MKRWPFGIFRLPEGGEGGGGTGTGTGTGTGEAPKTFNVNGKDIPIETVASAVQLHQALSDPEVGKEIIEQLARKTGLLKGDTLVESPKETEKKLEGKVTKMLKAKFGKDYEKFADTLGPVLDEAIQEMLEEYKTSTSGEVAQNSWESAVEKFSESHVITDDISKEMTRLINRNGGRPNLKGKDAVEWLTDMYELAAHKLGVDIDGLEVEEEDRNPRQIPANRGKRRGRNEVPEFREVERPKGSLSIDQIVDAAMKGQRFK